LRKKEGFTVNIWKKGSERISVKEEKRGVVKMDISYLKREDSLLSFRGREKRRKDFSAKTIREGEPEKGKMFFLGGKEGGL